MGKGLSGRRWSRPLCAVGMVLAISAVLAQSAAAVVVKVGAHQVAGVLPVRGVSPASIPGSYAKPASASGLSANGNLDYNGGIVLHGEAPYLIFWDPANQISAADKALYARFFADGATASGVATNVYSVDRQFTDSTGFADYQQTWSASHAITDTQAYPPSGQCTENAGYTESACLYDSQIQAEIARLVSAQSLPVGETGQAPIYFVVTPPTVNSCFPGATPHCADNYFCAYHSSFVKGPSNVLYADMPTVMDANNPKSCQFDNNSAVQAPNGRPIADVNLKAMSHEFNETITDPNGDAWWNNSSGNEDGDNCNFYGATVDPNNSANPNAFTPTLGGSASSGTLFNQLMNGNPYYTQSEWSNGNVNCEMQPAPATLNAAFSLPSSVQTGTAVPLDPTLSSSTAGYTSTSWSFGDGATSFSRSGPVATTHTFSALGVYPIKLTVVDAFGNLSSTTRSIAVHGPPTAAYAVTTANPQAGSPVAFDGSGSSESGGSISSYSWDFGDGSAAGSGVTPSHSYAAGGTYTVTLTVTDASASTASVSHTVTVAPRPTAAFAVTTPNPQAGLPVIFDGSGSSEAGGSIASYSWDFGDGSPAGSGVTPSHTYAASGTYTVTLTVTDAAANTATVAQAVTVAGFPTPVIRGLRLSPAAFAAARSGPSVTSAPHRRSGRASGATISYVLEFAATVRFTVARQVAGRRQGHGNAARCVAATPKNRGGRRCTRTVPLSGAFTQAGSSGANSLHFTGRLNGRKLAPGSYLLTVVASAHGKSAAAITIPFRIVG